MARQHINSYKNTEWDYITFSDIDTVRGLLKFRSRFDLLYERQNNNILSSDFDLASLKEDVICIYADLDRLIEKARVKRYSERVYRIIYERLHRERYSWNS